MSAVEIYELKRKAAAYDRIEAVIDDFFSRDRDSDDFAECVQAVREALLPGEPAVRTDA